MTSGVDAIKHEIDQVWDGAERAIDGEMREIVADHAARGLVRSGGTIRRVVRAAEPIARKAVLDGRGIVANRNSVVLRVKQAEFQAERIAAFTAVVEARLDAVGLGDRAGKALLLEAINRASRQEPAKRQPKGAAIMAWARTALAYIGDKVVVAILVGVAIAAISALLKLT